MGYFEEMKSSLRTKRLIVNTFTDMLKTTSLKDLHISDLCEKCDIDRKTFYYHFADKFDLIAWKIHQDWLNSLKAHENCSLQDRMQYGIQEVYLDQRDYYQTVFKYQGQNSLLTQMIRDTIEVWEDTLLQSMNTGSLSPYLKSVIRYHVYGMSLLIAHWIMRDTGITAAELSDIIYKNISYLLKDLDINQTFIRKMQSE